MNNLKNLFTLAVIVALATPMFGQSTSGPIVTNSKAFAALALGIAAFGGAMGQGKVVAGIAEAVGRNPSVSGKLFVPMLLGLAFIESLVLFTWLVVNSVS
jgi:F-type H+-transporting ATPase subunit c